MTLIKNIKKRLWYGKEAVKYSTTECSLWSQIIWVYFLAMLYNIEQVI